MPFGRFAFEACIAARTSSVLMPYLFSAKGSSSTRTAGSEPPPISTSPTPSTCDSRWRDHIRDRLVDLPRRLRLRGKREDDHRRRGRVRLAVGRVAAQGGRQVDAARVDRRLHLARGAVDVAAEVELQGHARRPGRARRGDLVDAGDRAEVALERRRDARRHRLGARAGDARADGDDGEVDLRSGETGSTKKAPMPASAIPTVSRTVPIGRLTKGLERFMAPARTLSRLARRATKPRSGRVCRFASAVDAAHRLLCGARTRGPSRNSRRSLRSLCSDTATSQSTKRAARAATQPPLLDASHEATHPARTRLC